MTVSSWTNIIPSIQGWEICSNHHQTYFKQNVCIYVYIHMYICRHVCIYIYIYVYIYKCKYVNTYRGKKQHESYSGCFWNHQTIDALIPRYLMLFDQLSTILFGWSDVAPLPNPAEPTPPFERVPQRSPKHSVMRPQQSGFFTTWAMQGGAPKIADLVQITLITSTYGRYICS